MLTGEKIADNKCNLITACWQSQIVSDSPTHLLAEVSLQFLHLSRQFFKFHSGNTLLGLVTAVTFFACDKIILSKERFFHRKSGNDFAPWLNKFVNWSGVLENVLSLENVFEDAFEVLGLEAEVLSLGLEA